MQLTRVVSMVVLLGASAVWAQDEDNTSPGLDVRPVRSGMDAPWSVGAGLSALATTTGTAGIQGPTAVMSIERLLTTKMALIFGVTLGMARNTDDEWTRSGSLGVGLRGYLHKTGPVAFSLHGLLGTGFHSEDLDEEGDSTRNSFGLGITGGGAVERELVDQLSLRIFVNAVNLGYTRFSTNTEVGGTTFSAINSNFSASLFFNPGIELRLAF